MNKIVFLLLIIINIPLCSWADEGKLLDSNTTKTETEDSKKKEQKTKDPEISSVYTHLFEGQDITKEDLEKNNLLIKMPKEEILINKPINTKPYDRITGEQILNVHERNQKKFHKKMLKTQNYIILTTPKKGQRAVPSPFTESSNNW